MKNCLVKEFKGNIANSSIPHYGGFTLAFKDAVVGTDYVRCADTSNPIEVFAKKGTFSMNGQTNQTHYKAPSAGGYNIYPEQSDTEVEIVSKYGIQSLGLQGGVPDSANVKKYVNLDELAYGSFILINGRIVANSGSLDLSTLPKMATNGIDISYLVEQGKPSKLIVPSDFRFPSSFTRLAVGFVNNISDKTGEDVELDLKSFENCVSLNNISLMFETTVTGNIDALCDTLYSNGKTSGSIFIALVGTGCIRGNKPSGQQEITSTYNVAFTSSGWTADIDQ